MIEIADIPQSIITDAFARARKLGTLMNSITSGQGNVAGYIGQALVAKHLDAQDIDDFQFDLIKDGVRFEVKTKRCTSKPRLDYDCSVSESNTSQQCDYYVFVRVMEDLSKAWILGKKTRKEYYQQSRFCMKGDKDTKSPLGWTFKSSCYNLAISELDPI